MKKVLLTILILLSGTTCFSKTWIITSSASYTFVPATLTITLGDSVSFQLASIHNATEVSLATWNVNGTTPLPGFLTPDGGGLVLPVQLTVGTHYYVCTNHVASNGMKGMIIVQSVTGIEETSLLANISIYPNPSSGKFRLEYNDAEIPSEKDCSLEIYNLNGVKIYETPVLYPSSDIDLSNQARGIYFIKIKNGRTVVTKKIVIQY
jgi:plastocyanin